MAIISESGIAQWHGENEMAAAAKMAISAAKESNWALQLKESGSYLENLASKIWQ